MEFNLKENLKDAALKVVADNEQGFFGMVSGQTTMRVCDVIVDGKLYQIHITATRDEREFIDSGEVLTVDFETEKIIEN